MSREGGDAPGLYVFCVSAQGALVPGPRLAGFARTPLDAEPLPPLVLWTQPLARPPEPSRANVLEHHRAVERAWREAAALLPMRFGQWFRDRDALRATLEPRADALAEGLERVREAGEHAVRMDRAGWTAAGPAEDAAPASGSARGRAYMEALARREGERREREAAARELADALAARVGTLARERRVEPLARGGLVSVAHLVARRDDDAFAGAVDAFGAENPGVTVVRGGPWPPWSFAP